MFFPSPLWVVVVDFRACGALGFSGDRTSVASRIRGYYPLGVMTWRRVARHSGVPRVSSVWCGMLRGAGGRSGAVCGYISPCCDVGQNQRSIVRCVVGVRR